MDGCKSRSRQEMRRLMDSLPLTNEMMGQPPRNIFFFYLNLPSAGSTRLDVDCSLPFLLFFLYPGRKWEGRPIMGTRINAVRDSRWTF